MIDIEKFIVAALGAILAILLTSCTGKVVSVPTPVACVNAKDIPPETVAPVLTGNSVGDVVILANKLLEQRAEAILLRALVKPCV